MITGIDVILYEKEIAGVDPFNAPVYRETPKVVHNVLVAPATAADLVDSSTIYGKKAVFNLAIPKGDTHNWEDTAIEFFGRKWKSFGPVVQGIDENIPLCWNKKVMVEAYGNEG